MFRCPAALSGVARLLVIAVALAAALGVVAPPRTARAAANFRAYATIGAAGGTLHAQPDGQHKVVATLAPGTTVELLDGPTVTGWYKVNATAIPEAKRGWITGDRLVFDRFVAAAASLNLFAGPGEWSESRAWVRSGIVMTVVGPGEGDYLLVQSGNRTGYAYVPALTEADGPATDPNGEHWVDVNRSTQEVHLMIGSTVVATYPASLSANRGDGFYATATGTYLTYSKVAGLSYTPYARAYITYWVGFDPDRDNGFHSWVMDANGNVLPGGDGPTGGCVATPPDVAAVIFDFVDIGTRVEIHW